MKRETFLQVKCGIYLIISPTGKIYVGQSTDIESRWYMHEYYFKMDKRVSKLNNSFKAHGIENHKFILLLECDKCNLNYLEQFYVKFYNSLKGAHGLNLTSGGDGNRDYVWSLASKNKLSNSKKGFIPWNKGLKNCYSNDTIKNMSISSKNKELIQCSYCNIKASRQNIDRWHNDKCKLNESNINKNRKSKRGICIYCNKEFAVNMLTKYHNDHCFKNPKVNYLSEKLTRKQSDSSSIKRTFSMKGRNTGKQTPEHIAKVKEAKKINKERIRQEKLMMIF